MMRLTLGDKVRELRLVSGLSVRKLAGKARISAPFLSDIELGKRSPSANVIERLETELGVKRGILDQHDLRGLKRLIDEDPNLGFALQAIAHEIQSRRMKYAEAVELFRAAAAKGRTPPYGIR